MEQEKMTDEKLLTADNPAGQIEKSGSSDSSDSDDSSDSSGDDRKKKRMGSKRDSSSSKSAKRDSKSRSRSREKERGSSPSDNGDKKFKKHKSDDRNLQRRDSQGNKKFRENHSKSRSRSQERRSKDSRSRRLYDGPLMTFGDFSRYECSDQKNLEKEYRKYKETYDHKQNKAFFAEHKDEEWFKEKYDVISAEKLKDERKIESRGNAERFNKSFLIGEYDKLNLNFEEFSHKAAVLSFDRTLSRNNDNQDDNDEFKQANNSLVTIDGKIDITTEPFFGFDPNSQTLFIKTVPKQISRWDLLEPLNKIPGFLSLSLSEPLKGQDFIRYGWALFDSEEKCNRAHDVLRTLNIKNYSFNIVKSKSQLKPLKICENIDKEKISQDIALAKNLIEILDQEKDIKQNILLSTKIDQPSQQLDLYLLYLRKVHSYCFYCATEYHDERMLAAKCGPVHLRRHAADREESHADTPDWHKKLTDIIQKRIQESKKDVQSENAEQLIDSYFRKKCEKLFKENGNWPCKFCAKVFKDDHFVLKHIKTKHPEKIQERRDKFMFENYANDKSRILGSQINKERNPYRRYQNNGQYGSNRKSNGGRYNDRKGEYKDWDDPKVVHTSVTRTMIDYGDL